jgi:hypothetical protein
MPNASEERLRWWAIFATIAIIAIAVLPTETWRTLISLLDAPTIFNYTIKAVFSGTILFLVLGFYVRMLFECGFGHSISHRGAWLVLLIIVPMISALIYYWITRSTYYSGRGERSVE